ncbi:BglG family transcription antiterminator [Enterococcus sp. LJL99]
MNTRMIFIGKSLIEMYPLTVKEVAKKFNVSERTVRNDIFLLNEKVTQVNGCKGFIRISNGTMKPLTYEEIDLLKSLYLTTLNHQFISQEQRKVLILFRLLVQGERLSFQNLSEQYFVSKSSIANDIQEIKFIFAKENLRLTSNKQGTYFKGTESEIQQLIKRILIDHCFINGQFIFTGNYACFGKWLNEELVTQVCFSLKESLKKRELLVSENYLAIISISIAILVRRSYDCNKIDYECNPSLADQLIELEPYPITFELVEELAQIISYQFNEQEIRYINQLFLGMGIRTFVRKTPYPKTFTTQISILIENVGKSIGLSLISDMKLQKDLCNHMYQLIYRLQSSTRITNPLLSEIKNRYALLYSVVWFSLNDFRDFFKFELSEEEVSFIVVHFQAAIERNKELKKVLFVCPNGVGTSSLIRSKIKRILPIILSYETISLKKMNTVDFSRVDFIISTTPIPNAPVPILNVSPMMTKQDMKNLTAFYIDLVFEEDNFNKSVSVKDQALVMDSFIKENVFFSDIKGKNNAIEFLLNQAEKNDLITDSFKDSVWNREKLSSTYLVDRVALPHGNPAHVKESFVSILILNKEINWDQEKVDMLILLGIKESDIHHSEKIMEFLLASIEKKKEFIQFLKRR